jgi:hypothetical protein
VSRRSPRRRQHSMKPSGSTKLGQAPSRSAGGRGNRARAEEARWQKEKRKLDLTVRRAWS